MAKKYQQEGRILRLTAPAGGVVQDRVYMFGQLPVVALEPADAGDQYEAQATGVWDVPFVPSASAAAAAGAPVYVDATGANRGMLVTTRVVGDTRCGVLMQAYVGTEESASVRLDGISRPPEA